MLYPPITLYPGGAFMICEDASEFDPNMPEPYETAPQTAERVEYELNQYPAEKEDVFTPEEREEEIPMPSDAPPKPMIIRDPTAEQEPTPRVPMKAMEYRIGDPVERVVEKLAPVYAEFIEPLMNLNYEFERPAIAIENMEWVTKNTRCMIDILRTTVVQLKALICSHTEDYSSFYSNIGRFMRNAEYLSQQGLGKFNYKYNVTSPFSDMTYIKELVTAVASNPQILTDLLTAQDIKTITLQDTEVPFADSFANTVDAIKCIFTESDRLAHFSTEDTTTLELKNLLTHPSWNSSDACPVDPADIPYAVRQMKEFAIMLLKLFSGTLKCVSMKCYDVLCHSTDNDLTSGDYERRVKPILCEIVNLFALGTIACLAFATELKKKMARANGVEQYTEQLIKALREVQ